MRSEGLGLEVGNTTGKEGEEAGAGMQHVQLPVPLPAEHEEVLRAHPAKRPAHHLNNPPPGDLDPDP